MRLTLPRGPIGIAIYAVTCMVTLTAIVVLLVRLLPRYEAIVRDAQDATSYNEDLDGAATE